MENFERIRKLIGRELTFPEADVTPQTSLAEIADRDSLDVTALFVAFEEEFDVEMGNETDWMRTVQDVMDFLDGKRIYPRLPRPVFHSETPVDHLLRSASKPDEENA